MANWVILLLTIMFVVTQVLYLLSMMIDAYLYTRPVNKVDMRDAERLGPGDYPFIVMFYPVLRELEATMRTTFIALANLDYPKDRFKIVAIPNADDGETIASLERLQRDFPFVDLLPVPVTTDPSWNEVWEQWQANPKAYWFHQGARAGIRDLPAKKTRQLIYAFYNTAKDRRGQGDFLVNYIDADSAPPRDHFTAAAVGIREFDVLQSTNIAGNLLDSLPASWFAFDHIVWDGSKYGHLTADGKHPYWVLGKGLFFKASDLIALGGFHPWLTIEDPEVGVRFWANGKRLGLIEAPLIEEVPVTLAAGIKQRTRWVAGFFQTLATPLDALGFSRGAKIKAWFNFLPCMSLWVNAIGIPVGIWAVTVWALGTSPLPRWTVYVAGIAVIWYAITMLLLYVNAWKRTAMVLDSRWKRLWYLIRVNPISLMIFWLIWLIPLWKGWRMYRRDEGLIWERTHKIDANATIVRSQFAGRTERTI